MSDQKYVYLFNDYDEVMSKLDKDWEGVRSLLGGKGANLLDATRLGIPVPPGFTVTTEGCNDYLAAGEEFPGNSWEQVLAAVSSLEEQTGKLEDVLKVEEQLSRVRGEIERLEGRMRVLKDLTSYSTVTINIQEIRGYVPPQSPTFGSRIGRAWTGTLEALLATLQNIVIGIVALTPWLLVLLIPFAIFVKFLRMLFRSKRVGQTMNPGQKNPGS